MQRELSEIGSNDQWRPVGREIALAQPGANDGSVVSSSGQLTSQLRPRRRPSPALNHEPDLVAMALSHHRENCVRKRLREGFVQQQRTLGLIRQLGVGREQAVVPFYDVRQAITSGLEPLDAQHKDGQDGIHRAERVSSTH